MSSPSWLGSQGSAISVAIASVVSLFLFSIPLSALACIDCGPVPTSLTTQLAEANAAVLVSWIGSVAAGDDSTGSTTFRVQRIVKGPRTIGKDQKVTIPQAHAAKPGEHFFLLGKSQDEGSGLDWHRPVSISEASLAYIVDAPALDVPVAKRLVYFLKFLEHPDAMIANDAFAEFANSDYKYVQQIANQLPRAKLRQWIGNPETSSSRLGLYGMMLGLYGDESDAEFLEKRILIQSEDYRLGSDGMMVGYLLLRKDKGLDVLDKHKLQNKKAPFSEMLAAMQAVRFMWSYGGGRIAPERLRQSMRPLLERTEITDLVIADLARWKDWSIQDRLMRLYGQGEYDAPSIKRGIVRYLLVSAQHEGDGNLPQHVLQARQHLDLLRKKDPKTVSGAEQFFAVP